MTAAHEYATEVMRILSDGTVPIGAWSERDRDLILRAITAHVEAGDGLDVIVDVSTGHFWLTAKGPTRVRLVDCRPQSVGRRPRDDVSMVNEALARIGVGGVPLLAGQEGL